MLCKLENKFIKFYIVFEEEINLDKIQKFLGNYAFLKEAIEINEKYDLIINFVNPNQKKNYINTSFIDVGNHNAIYNDNILYVFSDITDDMEIIFMKRLILDLINRFIELQGGIFLHSSSIIDSGKTIVFIGEKGAGKTTNMLYLLNDHKIDYSSNERTGLINQNGKIITYGNPSRINIRANTLKNNPQLKNKFWDCIDKEKYNLYSNLNLAMDCSERMIVTFDDISEKLGVNVSPYGELSVICNLIYDYNIDFLMEKTNGIEMLKNIENAIISGVFPERHVLNEMFFKKNEVDLNRFIKNNIRYYNIYQNNHCNNSEKILKRIRSDLRND